MEKGSGKISFFYSGIFTGSNLLSLQPEEFLEIRFNSFEESLSNPKNFYNFFNFNENECSSNLMRIKTKNKFDFDYIGRMPLNLFKFKNSEILKENPALYNDFEIIPPSFHKKEFCFDPYGIFFKTDFLVYEQVKIKKNIYLNQLLIE